ncbi:ankyrin repeat-containing protein [Talaromyces marneffei ATCC 18224]|uniref:Ankyrin repeat protein (Yar1), putative n=2 Tax=Talaromyces marneffei TaxID=37727 RepID=B6QFS3_TALMQ|nr:ankyrin repeat protein (Yar1), putative [Talaromyces marneffei ATCC 18224]
MSKAYTTNPPAPVALSFDEIDELIYNARLGDISGLKDEISKSAAEHNVSASTIIRSALDTEEESEGGTGACLLHWPAANGNVELLNYLLQTLTAPEAGLTPEEFASFINYRNYTGNTPLHWAALNTHLDCVKALVEAGADISLKNDAGHDALFLAERADWSVVDEDDNDDSNNNEKEEEIEIELNAQKEEEDDGKPAPPPTKARLVVEWLLSCDKGAGFEEPVCNKQEEDTKMEDAQ